MFPGPVFTFEMIGLARRRRYYALRFAYGLVLLWVIFKSALVTDMPRASDAGAIDIRMMAQIGQWLYSSFGTWQMAAVVLVVPALAAGVVAEARRRKTLDDLLTTPLSSGEIVAGKVLARLMVVGVLIALGMPILAGLSLFGGVDPVAVTLFETGCVTTAVALAGLSAVASVHSRRPREALTLTYVTVLAWMAGPPVVSAVGSGARGPWARGAWRIAFEWVRPAVDLAELSSPFALFRGGDPGGGPVGSVLGTIGLQSALGASLLGLAVWRLRPASRNDGAPARAGRGFARWPTRFFRRPPCGDDPLWWRERYAARHGRWARVALALGALGACGLIGYFSIRLGEPAFRELLDYGYGGRPNDYRREFGEFVTWMTTLIFVAASLGAATAGAVGITSEREGDTWVSLLASPLTAGEVVRAKVFGALWSVRWLGLAWLALVAAGVAAGSVHPAGFVAAGVVAVVDVGFAAAAGTFWSLRCRNSTRAVGWTLATVLFCGGFYAVLIRFLVLPFGVTGAPGEDYFDSLLVGVTPLMHSVALVSYQTLEEGFHSTGDFRVVYGALTVAASVAAYGVAAWLLLDRTVRQFDRIEDRPSLDRRPAQPPKGLASLVP